MAKNVSKPFAGDYPITQRFGENPSRYAQFGLQGHNGVDYGCPSGTVLLAPIGGKVVKKSFDPDGYGWFVEIWDPSQNLMTIEAHCDSVSVEVGANVTAGQRVGLSGNTGNSTGPHLHFAVGDTDSAGNRINTGNGYGGWYDPLDSSRTNLSVAGSGTATGGVPKSTNGTTTTLPTGPGGIRPGSYPPQSLTQDQRNFLYHYFGHTGEAPVGYGGETPGAKPDTPFTNTEGIPVFHADGGDGVYLQSQQGEVRLKQSVAELAKFGWNNLGFLKIKQIGGYEWSVWSGINYEGSHSRCGDSKWCADTTWDRDFGGAVKSIEIRKIPTPPPAVPQPPPPVVAPPVPPTAPGAEGEFGSWSAKKPPTHKDLFNFIAVAVNKILKELGLVK